MTFSILAVRTGEEEATELYPDPGSDRNTIELETADGRPQIYAVTSIAVVSLAGPKPKQTGKVADVEAALYVTNSRVAVACSKYDKGGGFGGWGVGLVVAAGANAVSKARAAHRRKGKMLVGHVRYGWLGQIEAKDRKGLGGKNSLQLLLADPTPEGSTPLVLDVVLDKHTPAIAIAQDIARRAARHKAEHVADDKHRPALEAFAEHPTVKSLDGGTVRYQLPLSVG